MRHIKYKAWIEGDILDTVKVQILEQTHRCFEFGDSDGDGTFNSASMRLSSRAYPEVSDHCVYMRGSLVGGNDTILSMSSAYYQRFKHAVKEYNEYYKD